jgi:hypothetical protein
LEYAVEKSAYNNGGYGYAKGIDAFFRDRKTINDGDFWVSYSLMDSKRKYLDFSKELTPGFISKHNLTLTYKHYLPAVNSYVSLGYKFASGRPYVNPNISQVEQQKTKIYSDVGLSIFHFTEFFNKFAMIYAQVNNLLGTDHVFGYRYSNTPDEKGVYQSKEITPVSRRFFLIGIHIALNGKPEM